MDFSVNQYLAAILMAGAAIAFVVIFRRYLAAKSEQRLQSMLEAVGLDPELAAGGDIPTIMTEVRQRCRNCNSEGLCERWLAGEEHGDNLFCPNHKVFEVLRKYSGAA